MKYDDFEASVCRESDMHGWRFFVTFFIKGGQVSNLYDATPKELASCLMGYRHIKAAHIKEIVQAYARAIELNAKVAA